MAFDPATLTQWRTALGGRAFLMCMGAHWINTALFLGKRLTESGYLTLFASTVGAYLMSHGVTTYMERKNGAA